MTRSHFNSSALVRLLSELAQVDGPQSQQDFAQRLGAWVDVAGAITLHAAQSPHAAQALATPSGAPHAACLAIQQRYQLVRSSLEQSFTGQAVPALGLKAVKLPVADADTPQEEGAAYAQYHQHYLAHQRAMDLNVGPLRAQARQALLTASPSLRQLAALDAALEQALGAHERKLLASVPALLEKRFTHLRQMHRQTLAHTAQADNPALWMQAGGWLAVFCQDMQSVLRAELEVRLQPVVGLIEAFSKSISKNE